MSKNPNGPKGKVTPASPTAEPPTVTDIRAKRPDQAAREHLEACAAWIEHAERACETRSVTAGRPDSYPSASYDGSTAIHPACIKETRQAGEHLEAALDHITWLKGEGLAESCRSKFWHAIDTIWKAQHSGGLRLRTEYLRAIYGVAMEPRLDHIGTQKVLRDLRSVILRWRAHLPVGGTEGRSGRPRKPASQVAIARNRILTAKTGLSQKQIKAAVTRESGRSVANIRSVLSEVMKRFGHEIESVADAEGDPVYRPRAPRK